MIGKLTGIIDAMSANALVMDVNGVGYVVSASARTLSRIGANGARASLLIDTHVREDAIQLFGFADAAEQRAFRLLTSVQGVGAKAGLAILSVLDPERLSLAIAAQDKAALTAADGVGPKLATRILSELKDKFDDLHASATVSGRAPLKAVPMAGESAQAVDQDALSALVNLGYQRSDAYRIITTLRASAPANDWTIETLIRESLKELAKNS